MKTNSHNGLSPTMVIRHLRSKLGALVQTLELSDQEMMRVIEQETLPTFSKYFPFLPMVTLTDKDKIDGNYMQYRLPNEWNLQILSVHNWFSMAEGKFGTGWIAPILTNPIDSQIVQDRYSMYTTPLVVTFYPPNRVEINQNFYHASEYLTIQFKAVHPNHMKSIDPNLRDEFLQLAFYDVCIKLYPLRHRFNTISTAYASLEPFTEILDNAASERAQLIERWERAYLFSGNTKKVWIM